MKKGIIFALTVVVIASAAAASVAVAQSNGVEAVAAGPSCKSALIGLDGPYTGPAASAGIDQRNWGQLFIQYWNAGKPIPGVPKGFKRTKLATPIEVDTQLDAQLAATAAVQLRSNKAVLAVNGFSGSQEEVAGGPILRRGGVALVSGSATRASLTDPTTPDGSVLKSECRRKDPRSLLLPARRPDGQVSRRHRRGVRAQEDGREEGRHGHDRRPGRGVLGAADHADLEPPRQGGREGRSPVAGGSADRLHPASNKAKAEGAKVVVLGSQIASNAQLFFQQLKSRGYSGGFLGTDGTFDSTKFTVPGAYISSFSLDIHDVPIAKPYTAAFEKQYGQTNSFGAPSWVAVQTIAMGISASCADGKTSRGEVRRDIGNVKLKTSLLGKPIAFDKFGDVVGGVGFTIFQIGSGGKYSVVQKG